MIENYISFFENLEKTKTIKEYEKIFDKNIYFKDPFHETSSLEELYNIFQKMYKNLYYAKFEVLDSIAKDKENYILKWRFNFKLNADDYVDSFEGLSEVTFKDGMAVSHIDYWDSAQAIYEKLPLIKYIIKFVKKQISK